MCNTTEAVTVLFKTIMYSKHGYAINDDIYK